VSTTAATPATPPAAVSAAVLKARRDAAAKRHAAAVAKRRAAANVVAAAQRHAAAVKTTTPAAQTPVQAPVVKAPVTPVVTKPTTKPKTTPTSKPTATPPTGSGHVDRDWPARDAAVVRARPSTPTLVRSMRPASRARVLTGPHVRPHRRGTAFWSRRLLRRSARRAACRFAPHVPRLRATDLSQRPQQRPGPFVDGRSSV